jgi:hydrogenase nickel incorporation protein HypA/HybF
VNLTELLKRLLTYDTQVIFYHSEPDFTTMVPMLCKVVRMHEMSLAKDMTRIIENALGRKMHLHRVNITVGPLSGISPESLRFCFTEIAKMDGFGEPELVINTTEARLVCLDCSNEYSARDFYEGCPECGSISRRILSGREFTVDSVEIDEGES